MEKLLLIFVLVFATGLFAQNPNKEIDTVIVTSTQKTIKYTDGTQTITVIRQPISNSASIKKRLFKDIPSEITYLENYIKQLETKIEIVRKNPSEDEIAKKEGWYEDMNGFISSSKTRIRELEKRLETKNNKQ